MTSKDRSIESIECSSPRTLQRHFVFVRQTSKHAIKIRVELPLLIPQFKQHLSKHYQIKPADMALFYNGSRIDKEEAVNILPKSPIIHFVNLKKVLLPQITIILREVKDQQRAFKLKIVPGQPIKTILDGPIKQMTGMSRAQIFLVYLGKPLNNSNTFAQELVQDGSQILIVKFKINKTNQALYKTISKEYQQSKPNQNKTIELLAPYKQNRSATEHDLWKQKKKNNLEEKMNKQKKEIFSMQKIEMAGAQNEEYPEEVETAPKMKLEQLNCKFQFSKEEAAPYEYEQHNLMSKPKEKLQKKEEMSSQEVEK